MSWFSDNATGLFSGLTGLLGLGYQISKDSGLTASEREANAFSAEQASIARNFEAQQAEIARDWQEQQYLQYNSPAAMIRQYQDAGLNPALMYESAGGSSASMSSPMASASGASSVSPSGAGNVAEMVANLSMLKAQIDNIHADTEQKRAGTRSTTADAILKEIDAISRPVLNDLGIKSSELANKEREVSIKLKEIDAQFKPQIFSQELEKGEVNIEQMKLGCEKILLEMNLLQADELKVLGEVELQEYTKALMVAQKVAANASARNMNAQAFESEWTNEFIKNNRMKPDSDLYSMIVQGVGDFRADFNAFLPKLKQGFKKFKKWYQGENYEE